MDNKFLTMLGFCSKAGKCSFGETAVEKLVKAGKAQLVLLSDTASASTQKGVRDMCEFRSVPLIICSEDIALACGKPGKKIIAIADTKFAMNIKSLYTQDMGV